MYDSLLIEKYLYPLLIHMKCIHANVNALCFFRPSPLILSAEGKTIDAKTGQAIQLTTYTPTLKVIL